MANKFLRKKPKNNSQQSIYTLFFRTIPWIVIFVGLWFATQSFAKSVFYEPTIVGDPFYVYKKNYPIYYPWSFLTWLFSYFLNNELQKELEKAIYVWVCFGILAIFLLIILASLKRFLINKNQKVFNSSELATLEKLKKAGMVRGEGVPLCQADEANIKVITTENGDLSLKTKKEKEIVNAVGKSHILVSAPPRSYKGVSVLLPALLQYKGSVFVTDYKGELYKQTAGFRRKFSRVILWAPGSDDSDGFNFLMQIRKGPDAWTDAFMLATTFLAPKVEGKDSSNEDHFRVNAAITLAGCCLHILCSNHQDKSLAGVMDWLTQADCGENNLEETGEKSNLLWEEMITTEHCDKSIHKKIVSCANAQLARPSRERGSVTSTILKVLMIFMDDRVRKNTSRNDFTYEDFINSDIPLSLYMSISNGKIDQMDVLIKLFVTMFLRRITDGETSYDDVTLKNELLFCLDEFHALGAFNFLQKAMAIVPGYGVRFLLVCQSFSQLESVYGKDHQFMALCKHIVIFAPGDLATAKHFSEVIGKRDIWKESSGTSGNRFDISPNNLSSNGSLAESNLINPTELMQLPFNKCLVFTQGMNPYYGSKIISYDDSRYKNKLFNKKNNLNDLKPPKTFAELQKEIAPLRKIETEQPWYALPLFTCLEKYEEQEINPELIDPRLQAIDLAVSALDEEPKSIGTEYKQILVGI